MTGPDHRRVQELFHGASSLDADARADYLAEACAGDEVLRREVESLLDATSSAGEFLQDSAENEMQQWVTPAQEAKEELPHSIGSYRITGILGRGGMGIVYEALDPSLERSVALKLLPAGIAQDSTALKRFRREARSLASLNHPGIATIYSLEEADGFAFFTLERIGGESLAERLKGGAMTVEESVRVCREVARALEAAHENGVVHCDLKPGNVMLMLDERVKVLDFGIARAVGELSSAGVPTGMMLASPGYASPEQLEGAAVDAATDVWALGCVLYECLSGVRPFGQGSLVDVLRRTVLGAPNWTELTAPAHLVELLRACLEKNSTDRPANMAAVRRALDGAHAGQRLALSPASKVSVAGNLPRRLTRFVGRKQHVLKVGQLLTTASLITLTGVGGSGKTRLAIQVAREESARFKDGAYLVELATVREPADVLAAVASVLGVVDSGDEPILASLEEYLLQRDLLLVLDNCEHVLAACADLAESVLGGPNGLRILATSRESIGIPGEHVYPVPALSVPSAGQRGMEQVATYEAVQLFAERAREARPEFVLDEESVGPVAEICRRLDGIPLALELAAARVRVFPLDEIASRLDDCFHLLTSGARTALPRHKTLRGTMDWSYELLEEAERSMLARISVFHGGATLDAIESVCAGENIDAWDVLDLTNRLVDKSLVELDPVAFEAGVGARYRMLETVRQYASEKLGALEGAQAVIGRFRDCYLDLLDRARVYFTTDQEAVWLDVLGRERGNIGEAINGLRDSPGELNRAMRLARGMTKYWIVRGELGHGQRLVAELLSQAGSSVLSHEHARLLLASGEMAWVVGELESALAHYESSLAFFLEAGNREFVARTRNMLGNLLRHQGEHEGARQHYKEALVVARDLGIDRETAGILGNLGGLEEEVGNTDRARELGHESLRLLRVLGDTRGVAVQLNNLGVVELHEGHFDPAQGLFRECLSLRRSIHDTRGAALALANLGELELTRGKSDAAMLLITEASALYREMEDRKSIAACDVFLGLISLRGGDFNQALDCFRAGFATYTLERNPVALSIALDLSAWVAAARGSGVIAAKLFGAAQQQVHALGVVMETWRSNACAEYADQAREDVGSARFDAERESGAQLGIEEALALAHEVLG
ncbi:MAG: putative ATPase/serine/threonine protein kinase [Candidatus Paceibacteria bacterium]|jgi:predicted ATPase/serine/threonine protein kinase